MKNLVNQTNIDLITYLVRVKNKGIENNLVLNLLTKQFRVIEIQISDKNSRFDMSNSLEKYEVIVYKNKKMRLSLDEKIELYDKINNSIEIAIIDFYNSKIENAIEVIHFSNSCNSSDFNKLAVTLYKSKNNDEFFITIDAARNGLLGFFEYVLYTYSINADECINNEYVCLNKNDAKKIVEYVFDSFQRDDCIEDYEQFFK